MIFHDLCNHKSYKLSIIVSNLKTMELKLKTSPQKDLYKILREVLGGFQTILNV